MEPRVINRSVVDERILKSATYRMMRNRTIGWTVVYCLLLVYYVHLLINIEHIPWYIYVLLLLFVGTMVYILILPALTFRRRLRAMRELGKTLPETVCVDFYDDSMETWVESTADRVKIQYASVKKIIAHKDLILPLTHAKQYLILTRDGFAPGAEAAFWALMQEKCPAAVPKQRRTAA